MSTEEAVRAFRSRFSLGASLIGVAAATAWLSAGCSSSTAPAPAEEAGAHDSAAAEDASASIASKDAGGEPRGTDGATSDADIANLTMPDAAPTTIATAGTTNFDLVSPAQCAEKSSHLVDCVFAPLTIQWTGGATVSNVETTMTVQTSGDCSSQYPLALDLAADDAPSTRFHIEDGMATIARSDGAAIGTLTATDASPWTGTAAYNDSCRMSVQVRMNIPAGD